MNTQMVLLQVEVPPESGSMWSSLIFIILLIVIFWLFFIRPKRKNAQEKEQITIQSTTNSSINQPIMKFGQPFSQQQSFCSSCGSKLNEGVRFCPKCGNPISVVGQNISSTQQYRQTVPSMNTIPNVYIKGKILTKTQRILNLVSADQLIDVFSFSNGMVSIKTQGNKTLYAPLCNMSVYFQYNPSTEQRIATINYQGNEIEFVEASTSINKVETSTIFDILSKAGTTYGVESISPEGIAMSNQIKRMNQQAAIARQISYNQGYMMGQIMKR